VADVVSTLGRREERERGSREHGDVVEGARSRGPKAFSFANAISIGSKSGL
jgi:hypothetical protein